MMMMMIRAGLKNIDLSIVTLVQPFGHLSIFFFMYIILPVFMLTA